LYLKVKDDQDWAKELREDIHHYRQKYDEQRRTYMLQHLAAARDLDHYTGIYENTLYGRVEIGREGNALTLVYRNRPHVKLRHWNGNTFQFEGSELSCGFSGTDLGEIAFSDGRGKSEQMMISLFHEGADSVFQRVK